jgi:hypothetical protein
MPQPILDASKKEMKGHYKKGKESGFQPVFEKQPEKKQKENGKEEVNPDQ